MIATLCLISTMFVAAGANSQAGDNTGETTLQRPSYNFLRFNEDWSTLRGFDPSQRDDPLNEKGDIWLSFGGHTRARFEAWDGFGFGAPADDDDAFLLWRLALHADLHIGEHVRAFVEGKTAQATDRELPGGRRTLDVDSLDLEQAFIDVSIPFGDAASLTLRPGRQVFLFGKQRLVSPLPWANTLRRWDGVSAILDYAGWKVHGFWSEFAPVQKHAFNDPDAQTQFFGVYATGKIPTTAIGLDLYFLGLDQDDPVFFNGTAGPEERYTVGGRLFGAFGDSGFDYDLEGAYQFGEVGAGDVSAFMIGSQLGFTPADVWGAPRFFVGFDYASGDDSPGGDVETFNQLFPLGHAYYGYADFVGRQNAIDLSAGVTLTPIGKLSLGVTGHFMWLDEPADALYNAGGAVVRPGLPGADPFIGTEIDLTATYKFDRHLAAEVGYAHFFTGGFIDDTGPDEDLDFLYAQLQYTF